MILGALAAPAVALASGSSSGGAGFGAPSGGSSTPSGGPTAQPTTATVQASGNGITIITSPATLLRHKLTFSGTVARAAGKVVEIERRSTSGGNWLATTHGTAGPDGAFSATWPTSSSGRFAVRAVIVGSNGLASASASSSPASPSLTVTVYKPAIATTYGEGSWGSRTACGQILRHTTLGVANRTLPCGTKVSILWHHRTLVVPVIDRGPYANHADWDLTLATAQALGIGGTETIGAASVGR